MLLSSAGYFATDYSSNKSSKIIYNSIEFKQDSNGYWNFETKEGNFKTFYNPEQTQTIKLEITSSILNLTEKNLYIDVGNRESYSSEIVNEISNNLKGLVSKISPACVDASCQENYAIKNCSEDNIIRFNLVSENSSSQVLAKENCVVLNYRNNESAMVADAFLFRMLGLQ